MKTENSGFFQEIISVSTDISAADNNRRWKTIQAFSLISAGVFLLLRAIFSDDFRAAENHPTARFCLFLAAFSALAISGAFLNSRWRYFANWSALALLGQAASLQMISAGRSIHFQHYESFPALLGRGNISLILLAAQIVLVAFGIRKHFSAIKNRLFENFTVRRLMMIAAFLILAGAAVTPDVSIYATSVFLAGIVQTINLANVILIARAVPDESLERLKTGIEIFLNPVVNKKRKLDRFSMSAAAAVIVVSAFLSYFVYQNHPHVPDETQYLFQAKYFAAGQLTVKAPLVPEAFAMYMIPHDEAAWFSIFPPGWAAVLAIGEKLGAAWLVNPLLAGFCVLLAYVFFEAMYSRSFARIAVVLLCCSPWFVFMAMSLMSHILTLCCTLSAAVLFLKGVKDKKIFYFFAAGLCAGTVSLIRPLDGAAVAFGLGIWTLIKSEHWRAKLVNGFLLTGGTVATAALIFPYNQAVTGNATLSPMDFYYAKYYWSGAMNLGFGANRGIHWELDALPGHSPLEALINAALNTFSLNTELFGWATGSLILIVIFLCSKSVRRTDGWAVVFTGLIVAAYSLYWYHGGPDFGARYWFLTIIPLVALTVRGIEFVSSKIDAGKANNPRVLLAAATLCAISLLNFFPWRANDKYFHYLGMQPDISQLARDNNFGRSLIIIRGAEHPDYQSAWIDNPVNFDGDAPVFANDKSLEIRARLWNAYADRPLWIVDGPSLTGSGYKIIRGPIYANNPAATEINAGR